jgi:Ca2+-binding RTX toxin-like protein
VLIGGNGRDTIVGGPADDIVIGGSTTYSMGWHYGTLMDILAVWQSADSYTTRISNLRSGYHGLVPGTTVLDDGSADRLTGGGGMDWFFPGSHGTITDHQAGEVVN